MTTIRKASRPLLFWHVGGDIVMKMTGGCWAIDRDQQEDLRDLFADEILAARANGATEAWLAALDKAHQLTEAQAEADRWSMAMGRIQ